MEAADARRLPLLGAMARDLDEDGTIRPATATAMWAAYLAHATLTLHTLRRPRARLPLPDGPARLAGAAAAFAGLAACLGGMGRFAGPRELSGLRDQPLTTTGIYRHSRNPQYLGYVTALTGLAVARRSGTGLACAVVLALAYDAWIPVEEQHLARSFGRPYVEYLGRTHRWWGRDSR